MSSSTHEDVLEFLPDLPASVGEGSLPVNSSGAQSLSPNTVVAAYDLGDSPPKAAVNTHFGPAAAEPAPHDALATVSLDEAEDRTSSTQQAAAAPHQQDDPVVVAAPDPAVAPGSFASSSGAAPPAAGSEQAVADPIVASAGGLHAQDVAFKVWVRDPQQERKNFINYITYLLRTECSLSIFADAATPAQTEATSAAAAAEPSTSSSRSSTPAAAAGGTLAAARRDASASSLREGLHVFDVRRRFSDFEELHRLLKHHYRGYFFPPLPDKAFLDSSFFKSSFLKVRQVDLQAYMSTVANHPALQDSEELRLFLTFSGELASCPRWQQLVQRPGPSDILLGLLRPDKPDSQPGSSSASHGGAAGSASHAASGGGGSSSSVSDGGRLGGNPLGMMMRMKHSLMNVVQQNRVKHEVPVDEQQLRQAKEWFKELQQHLSACVAVVRSLVSHLEAVAEDFNDLGRTLSHMARYEEALAQRQGQYTPSGGSAVQRAADLQLLGYAALRQQTVEKQFVLRSGASLVYLHDWWVLIPEVVASLEEREGAWEAVQLLGDELQEKQAAASKAAAALGPAAAGDKRLNAMRGSIEVLQEKMLAAKEQYQVLKERNQAELVRLNLQRAIDFRGALHRFAQIQAQLAAASKAVWDGVVDQWSSGLEQSSEQL